MTTISLQLHAQLFGWLQQVAEKRNLSVEQAIPRLLDEARMVDCCLKTIEVPESDQIWAVSVPTRAHIYTGYNATWTKLHAGSSSISKD